MRKYVYAVLAAGALLGVVVAVLVWVQHPIRSAEDLWNRPWPEVRAMAEEICDRYTTEDPAYFEQCMAVEKQSYELLQGDCGLANEEAESIKQDCAGFHYFTPQVKCVEEKLRQLDG